MGSQLGLARRPPLPHDIVWLDPIDIQLGRLATLRLPGPAPIVPLGVVLYSYLRLKFYLRSEEHTSELQSRVDIVCRLLVEKKEEDTAETCDMCGGLYAGGQVCAAPRAE